MDIIRSVQEMQNYAVKMKKSGKIIGFVPTMGYLHEGHEQLMKKARKESDIVITSIFVNPLQFGPNEDLDRYPRDEDRDIAVGEHNKVDVLFIPTVDEMYPTKQGIRMDVTDRTNVLCGRSRTSHFAGVIKVLAKLFNITVPDQVYMGMKDAQQVAVVDLLVESLNYPITIVPVSTVREEDGLAKSSRNVYLSDEERKEAAFIYKALRHGQQLIIDGEKKTATIIKEVENYIIKHTSGKIDYVEILSYPELTPVDVVDKQVILATAVHFKQARLIDNLVLNQVGVITEQL